MQVPGQRRTAEPWLDSLGIATPSHAQWLALPGGTGLSVVQLVLAYPAFLYAPN